MDNAKICIRKDRPMYLKVLELLYRKFQNSATFKIFFDEPFFFSNYE